MEKCSSCEKEKEDVRERTVKENGVVGYYDVKVKWCDDCSEKHNRHLLETWG